MAFLGFGRAKKLEDLNVKDLRKERVKQEVEQDKLLTAIRRAQQEYDRRLELASEPGVGNSEKDVAAYRMSLATKRKSRAEADLQRVITRMTVLDSAMEVIRMKKDLQKRGVWKRINNLDEGALEEQLDAIAIRTKAADNKLETIVNMLTKDEAEVAFDRGPEFDRARAAIEDAASEKIS